MNQSERRLFLIDYLSKERKYNILEQMPDKVEEQKRVLRSLINIREAAPASQEFLQIQDEYLQEENRRKGIVKLDDISPIQPGIYLWRGDITRLSCGAVVNAANSGMTGCYQPCHNCIDNCIHTYAGVQLRNYCNELMEQQGYPEPTGQAKITPAFNLPCDYVIHTVGPIVHGSLTKNHCEQLASCYRTCLQVADENQIESIAFCCISTGVFMFPNEKAAEIAVEEVKRFRQQTNSSIEVIYNVFKEEDEQIYRRFLNENS